MEQIVQREASGKAGIVCTSDCRASQAGLDMLEAGGNCIDAVIAAAAVLNVVEPANSHLGGDAFMLVWMAAEGKVTAVNGSGAAPFGTRLQDFAEQGIPLRGIRAATVPGEVHAWFAAHRRWGQLPIGAVLAPAIHYAEKGATVFDRLAKGLANATDCYEQAGFKQQFMPDGKPPTADQTLRQPNVAEALRLLARDGEQAFYHGPIAEALVKLSKSQGGWFEARDLAAHHTYIQQPIAYDYNGWQVNEQPAPSQGVIVLQCLALARQLGLEQLAYQDPLRAHLMIETIKAAFADRFRWWADPAFTRLPTAKMLSDEYAAERASRIDRDRAAEYEPGDLRPGRDTTYLCAADGEGNAVSFIQSVFHGFGSGVVEPTFGIVLNNRMNGFNVEKGHPNCLQPGKRPVHTLNAWMVLLNDRPVLVGGTPGGANQVQWNFQALTALLDKQMSPVRTLGSPRWSWDQGLKVRVEPEFGQEAISALGTRGHDLTVTGPLGVGGSMQLISLDAAVGTMSGACDPRVPGAVLAL